MTNDRAIELLHRLQDEQFDGIHGDERREALEMAVRALEGDEDTISRQAAIDATWFEPSYTDPLNVLTEVRDRLKALSSAQPTYTDEEIQKMQDLEAAEIEKAYQLGYEEGKKDAQPEQKMGRWIVKRLYVQCSVCGDCFPLKPQNYCPSCGARMDGESDES